MTKAEFKVLFDAALERAAVNADEQLGYRVPRNFHINFGNPRAPVSIPAEEALDRLYLGEDRFFPVIDVAVVEVGDDRTIVYVRPSGHTPGPFERTWNDPPGSGPFHQLIAQTIKTPPTLPVR
jgi:hypothetical protein